MAQYDASHAKTHPYMTTIRTTSFSYLLIFLFELEILNQTISVRWPFAEVAGGGQDSRLKMADIRFVKVSVYTHMHILVGNRALLISICMFVCEFVF